MERNNNGKGMFYGVLAVATLVVAIIGATFAYFSATATNTETIQGEAATTGLNLEVNKISLDAAGALIPLNDSDTGKALAGDALSENKMCVDQNGNSVCQVYEIAIANTGTAAAVLNGNITITGTTFQNLKWQLLDGTAADALSIAGTPTYNPIATTSLVRNLTLTGTAGTTPSAKYYVMVWISNLNETQNETDKGSFTGTVTFNSADGSGISATFSSTTGGDTGEETDDPESGE